LGKFLSWDFALVLLLAITLLIVHETGHFIAYRIFGIKAKVRRSILVPGIDPVKTVTVPKWKGILIALGGFIFAGFIVNIPLYILGYKHSYLLLIGGIAGSIVDFIWAITMLGNKTVTLQER